MKPLPHRVRCTDCGTLTRYAETVVDGTGPVPYARASCVWCMWGAIGGPGNPHPSEPDDRVYPDGTPYVPGGTTPFGKGPRPTEPTP